MVLGKPPVPGSLLIWIIAWQGPTVLAVGASGCLHIFSLVYRLSSFSLSRRRPDIDWNTVSKGQ